MLPGLHTLNTASRDRDSGKETETLAETERQWERDTGWQRDSSRPHSADASTPLTGWTAGNEEVGVEEDELRVKPEAAEAAEAALSQVKANVSANLAARAEAKALESTLTDIVAQAEAFRNQAKAEAAFVQIMGNGE